MKKTTRTENLPKIILLLRIDIASGRQQMSGIFRYIRDGHPWNVRLQHPATFTRTALREAIKDGIDGIIASENDICGLEDILAKFRTPVSVMDPSLPTMQKQQLLSAFISIDDKMIGKSAAAHILSCGNFRSYAFIPDRPFSPWARRREEAFVETVKPSSDNYSVFPSDKFRNETEDRRNLRKWLIELPKPAAVMAACDYRAVTVIEVCNESKIAVPSAVSIISVDNDELYGDNLSPSLSSVEPDFEKEGYVAATQLGKLMKTRRPILSPVLCPVKRVVVRESTASTPPAARLIRDALNYIKNNALSGISVTDVVTHMHCSRRLADLRFREFNQQSIRRTIEDRKLIEVKRLLQSSGDSFTKIALRCGFPNLKALERTFRRRTGMSLGEWRNR